MSIFGICFILCTMGHSLIKDPYPPHFEISAVQEGKERKMSYDFQAYTL